MILCSLWLFVTQLYATTLECPQQQCIAIVDAGSTGARLHIYAYDLDATQSPINIQELWLHKIQPGLATLKPSQSRINAYLNSLFAQAPLISVPVYFYATDGMRLLPITEQHKLYSLLQNWFAQHELLQLREAKTITGKQEGLYGWLSVNYQLGTLQSKELVGVMDLGGASVQVMFPVKYTTELKLEDLQKITIYGRTITLFIHSFLGLGQTEVSHQFLEAEECFANNYELPTGLLAAGDAYVCENDIALLMNGVHKVSRIVQAAIASNPISSWVAIGSIAELVANNPLYFEKQFTNQDLLAQANLEICHQSWPSLNSKYPKNDYIYGYCLFSAYYYALMVDGYGLSPQQAINLMPATNNWTLGVILSLNVGT